HIVPPGNHSAASLPSSAATRSCSALTVGSSPRCSSPTSAPAMASRIAAVGLVSVSLISGTMRAELIEVPFCRRSPLCVFGEDMVFGFHDGMTRGPVSGVVFLGPGVCLGGRRDGARYFRAVGKSLTVGGKRHSLCHDRGTRRSRGSARLGASVQRPP